MIKQLRVIIFTILAFVLLFAFSPARGALALPTRELGQTTTEGVRLRKESNTTSEILAELAVNTSVEIIEEKDGWVRVLYGDVVGYIRQDYLFINSTGSRAAYVLQDGAKLRGGPGESSYVVAELSASQGVKVKQLIDDWYFVVAGDHVGYVHSDYLSLTKGTNAASNLLKAGMEGQEVLKLQTELSRRGFLAKAEATGTFGSKTRTAVMEFQKACGFSADGIAGAQTLEAIYDTVNNKVMKDNIEAIHAQGRVELLDWFKGGSDLIYRGAKFTIIDVKTKKSFRARRFGGWYHADTEPLTAADTAKFKEIVGTWSWDRRPVWVVIGNRVIAASCHSMPHMDNPTKSNNYDGHFCLHLLNSMVHENSKKCPRHQACVQSAYRAGRSS